MIIPDINILVYAYDRDSSFYTRSALWWQTTLQGTTPVGLPWAVILGFTRIVSNPKMYSNAVSVPDALIVVDSWLRHPITTILEPGTQHWQTIKQLAQVGRVGTKLVSDIHLAAIAIEHRATLVTNDRDFQRFSTLKTHNPLKGGNL